MSTKTIAIETACAAFHRTLVGDAKLPSQHAINRDGIDLLEALMLIDIAQGRILADQTRSESPENCEDEVRRIRYDEYAMRCAMEFLKSQHNMVPVVSLGEARAIDEASAAL